MPLKVLLICGHPRRGSLCCALAASYAAGARIAGADVRWLDLAEQDFAVDVVAEHINQQPCEPDVVTAQGAIAWAEHIVLVFPTWWGLYPARMKGFLDRVLTPGFAFAEADRPSGFEGRLGGRSAHLLTTMDTPGLVYRLVYGSPGRRALARATLGFCGVAPVRFTAFGPVRTATLAERETWLLRAAAEGRALRGSSADGGTRLRGRIVAWLRVLRLQFYPMAWLAYAAGALHAAGGRALDATAFLLGLVLLVLLEAAAVMTNEIVDLEGDRLNRRFGPFNGGSRVLVDGSLAIVAVRRAAIGALLAAGALAALLVAHAAQPLAAALCIGALGVLAIGYSLPPLRLSARGWGEVTVALTHSIGVMSVGMLLQGGTLLDPWLIETGMPLGMAIMPAIILANVPDRASDALVGKRTLPVRLGTMGALLAAGIAAAGACALAVALSPMVTAAIVVAPTSLLVGLLWRAGSSGHESWQLNPAIAVALCLVMAFVASALYRAF
jgi:1,4-dihydroxy-2-naphthoate octaprenyltransferase